MRASLRLTAVIAFAIATPALAQTSATQSASGTVKIISPITLTKTSDLAFGTVVRPTTGANTITIDSTTGNRTLTGAGDGALASSTTSRAAFTVNGEGGQTFSITAPATFNMTRSGGSETLAVTVAESATSGTLSGSIGSAGSATFGVGGSFPVSTGTVSGAYSGAFNVTAAYN